MSEIRVTSVVGENGGDRVGLTTGLTVGPLTGTTGIGVTITHQGHAQFAGVCTASSFVGSGANLTGISAGKVLQIVQGITTALTTFNSSGTYVDTGLTATLTPSAASSKILVSYDFKVGSDAVNWRKTRLQRSVNSGSYSSVTNGFAMEYAGNTQSDSQMTTVSLEFLDTPSYSLGQTVAYKVQVETGGSTFKMNAPSNQSSAYGISTITLYEVAT